MRQPLGQLGLSRLSRASPDRGQAPGGTAMLSQVSVALSDIAGVFPSRKSTES